MKEKDTTQTYTRRFVSYLYPMLTRKNKFAKGNNNRTAGKFPAVFTMFAADIIKRWFWLMLFVFVPAILLEKFRPGLTGTGEILIVFLWFWMIIVREGLVYTSVLKVGADDRTMFRAFDISPRDNFLGKFVFKIWTELIYHAILLLIFRVSLLHTLCIVFMTLFFRIIGERREIKVYQKRGHIDFEKRAGNKIIIQIVCVCAAYGFPLVFGIMSTGWFWLVNPIVAAVLLAKSLLDWRSLSRYKDYGYVISEVVNRGTV